MQRSIQHFTEKQYKNVQCAKKFYVRKRKFLKKIENILTFTINYEIIQFNFLFAIFLIHDIDKKH